MKGGSIVINGNAGSCLGPFMEKGTITVNGNVLGSVCGIGGTIFINGEFDHRHTAKFFITEAGSYESATNIYHYDKLIFKRGKEVKEDQQESRIAWILHMLSHF